MNEQQMKEKYKGIVQYQCECWSSEPIDQILTSLVSLLDLSFDRNAVQRKRDQQAFYYTQSKRDPRCLLFVDFSNYLNLIIIRFPQHLQSKVHALLRNVTNVPLTDTLIQQSKMNGMVKRYQLDIEIVDEYDLFTTTFQQKSFWNEHVKLNNAEVSLEEQKTYPELVEPICIEIAEGIELSIEIGDAIHQTMLFLKHPSLSSRYELGWDDLGHWHPHVLRWEELEKIVYFLTIQDPDHFVVPFLLLLPFAPITKEERAIARKIKAAWRSLQLFQEEEIETFDRQIPYMPDFVWSYSQEQGVHEVGELGWDVYSKRHIGSDFPFEAFYDLLQRIDSVKHTDAWQQAIRKWEDLIQRYSTVADEDWFQRRGTADFYHTSM